ncbi:uncharacterized protein LOC140704266 isoform X1 [Pogona vitticeps]
MVLSKQEAEEGISLLLVPLSPATSMVSGGRSSNEDSSRRKDRQADVPPQDVRKEQRSFTALSFQWVFSGAKGKNPTPESSSVCKADDLGQILLPERHFLKKEFNEIQVLLLKPHVSPGGSCLEAWKWTTETQVKNRRIRTVWKQLIRKEEKRNLEIQGEKKAEKKESCVSRSCEVFETQNRITKERVKEAAHSVKK